MLHLALKAFYPAKPPFPLLHVDTTWKFREMIAFRDATAARLGRRADRPHQPGGLARGINPIASGSALHTQVMKTEALKQALDKYGFDAAIGGARRDEEKSRAKERIFSFRGADHAWDPRNQRPELWQLLQHPAASRRIDARLSAVELDRARCLAIHRRREHRGRAALFRQAAAGGAARRRLDHGRRRSPAARTRRSAGNAPRPLPHPRLLSADRRDRVRRRQHGARSSPSCAARGSRSGRGG